MGDSAIDALDALLSESGVGDDTEKESGDSGKIDNYVNLMKKVPLLRSLTEQEQRKIAALLKPVEFEDGDKIVTQGEEGDAMYFVESGQVRARSFERVLQPPATTPPPLLLLFWLFIPADARAPHRRKPWWMEWGS